MKCDELPLNVFDEDRDKQEHGSKQIKARGKKGTQEVVPQVAQSVEEDSEDGVGDIILRVENPSREDGVDEAHNDVLSSEEVEVAQQVPIALADSQQSLDEGEANSEMEQWEAGSDPEGDGRSDEESSAEQETGDDEDEEV